jgi:hypothetical protein
LFDRPSAEWPRGPDGGIAMRVEAFDLRALVLDRSG